MFDNLIFLIISRLMVQAISPMSSKELYTFVVQPYLEGSERLNRAWQGIDFHSLTHAKFSLKERAVFLLTGIVLVFFPLINSVIWLAWKTFGNPEILSDPYISAVVPQPEEAPTGVKEIPLVKCCSKAEEKGESPAMSKELSAPLLADAVRVRPIEDASDASKVEFFSFAEKSKSFCGKTDWRIERLPGESGEFHAAIESPREKTWSRYNKKGEIQEYYFKEESGELHASLSADRRLKVRAHRGNRIGERDYKLEKNYVWLQQATLGLKSFILDPNQKEVHFYSIRPDNIDLVEVVVRKKGEENLPGFGKAIRAELKMDHYFYRFFREGELWFDPETGKMLKLVDSGRFMETLTSELIP